MRMVTKKIEVAGYICPFCKEIIKASKKTDIFYRNIWIKGCYDCFALSIDKKTTASFQEKNY
jgi:hypothetical protein